MSEAEQGQTAPVDQLFIAVSSDILIAPSSAQGALNIHISGIEAELPKSAIASLCQYAGVQQTFVNSMCAGTDRQRAAIAELLSAQLDADVTIVRVLVAEVPEDDDFNLGADYKVKSIETPTWDPMSKKSTNNNSGVVLIPGAGRKDHETPITSKKIAPVVEAKTEPKKDGSTNGKDLSKRHAKLKERSQSPA